MLKDTLDNKGIEIFAFNLPRKLWYESEFYYERAKTKTKKYIKGFQSFHTKKLIK